jgi:hypothetical protein
MGRGMASRYAGRWILVGATASRLPAAVSGVEPLPRRPHRARRTAAYSFQSASPFDAPIAPHSSRSLLRVRDSAGFCRLHHSTKERKP